LSVDHTPADGHHTICAIRPRLIAAIAAGCSLVMLMEPFLDAKRKKRRGERGERKRNEQQGRSFIQPISERRPRSQPSIVPVRTMWRKKDGYLLDLDFAARHSPQPAHLRTRISARCASLPRIASSALCAAFGTLAHG